MKNADLVLIHGIGPFNEELVVAKVRGLLRKASVSLGGVKVVNWRRVAGDLSQEGPEFLQQVASISRGIQGTLHIESHRVQPHVQWVRSTVMIAPLICAALLLIPVPLLPFLALAIFGTVSLVNFGYELWAQQRGFSIAVASTLLPWLWAMAHGTLTIPYVFLRMVASRIGCWFQVLAFLSVLVAMTVLDVGVFSIFLPPLVLLAVTHAGRIGFFETLVPSWRESVERTSGSLLLLAADVVRYTGDLRYRTAIQQKTMDAIRTRRNGPVIVVAHSLGSVIAFDALAHLTPEERMSVVLITMGSPLRRLMHRFLPASYPLPEQARAHLLKLHRLQRWINVYRSQDIVGAALFGGSGGDFATSQHFGGPLARLRAHLDYWNDSHVLATVLGAVRLPLAANTDAEGAPKPLVNGRIPADSDRFAQVVELFALLLAAATLARLVWLLIWVHQLAPMPLVTIVFGLILLLLTPSTLKALYVYPLSFLGLDRGTYEFVPTIVKTQEDYEESLRE